MVNSFYQIGALSADAIQVTQVKSVTDSVQQSHFFVFLDQSLFSSPEAMPFKVSTKNHDIWEAP